MSLVDNFAYFAAMVPRPARIVDTTDDAVLLEWAASPTTLTLQEWAASLANPVNRDPRDRIADVVAVINAQKLPIMPGDVTYVVGR